MWFVLKSTDRIGQFWNWLNQAWLDMNVDKFKLDLGQMMKPELIQTKPHTNCKFPTQVQSNRLKLGPNRTLL